MAKKGIDFGGMFRPGTHTDAVSGESKQILRKAHNNQHSSKLKAFQKCVRSKMEGQKFGSAKEVRQALASAARACKGAR